MNNLIDDINILDDALFPEGSQEDFNKLTRAIDKLVNKNTFTFNANTVKRCLTDKRLIETPLKNASGEDVKDIDEYLKSNKLGVSTWILELPKLGFGDRKLFWMWYKDPKVGETLAKVSVRSEDGNVRISKKYPQKMVKDVTAAKSGNIKIRMK